jgi:2-dehydro-3-deoxyphosphogluconate aldolase/(4S)-4-hydroxy-2-oxoglutarate aldolase
MLNELLKHPIIPVIVIDDAKDAEPLAEALLKGGMNVIEVTFRTAAAADAIARIVRRFPEMLVGAGTILTAEQAQRALDAGISFGLAPGLNAATIARFRRAGVPFVPGVMTPSDIEAGLALDCKVLKFFPAEAAGGVKMVKALNGPYASQGVKFCPTGGVGLHNMNDYLAISTVASVGGSWLATQQQIAGNEWSAITRQVEEALAAVNRD